MPALSVDPVFFTFTDVDGQPLEAGDIYVGVSGLDPITNPINVYWDAALSQLATQPIKTRGGYPLNGSAIGRLYVNSDYSIKVASRAGNVVYSATSAGERISSDLVTFLQAGTGAVQRTVQSKLRDTISVMDFGAVGDGVTDDTTAIQAAIDFALSTNNIRTILFKWNHVITDINLTNKYNCGLMLVGANASNQNGLGSNDKGTIIVRAAASQGFDLSGSTSIVFRDMTISGDSAAPPRCGLFLSRVVGSPECAWHKFTNVNFYGTFTSAAVYNYAGEGTQWNGCFITNDSTTGHAWYGTTKNSLGLASKFQTPDETATPLTLTNFINCIFDNAQGAGASTSTYGAWFERDRVRAGDRTISNVNFQSCYMVGRGIASVHLEGVDNDVQFISCTDESLATGGAFDNEYAIRVSGSAYLYGLNIINCTFFGGRTKIMLADNLENLNWIGCYVYNAKGVQITNLIGANVSKWLSGNGTFQVTGTCVRAHVYPETTAADAFVNLGINANCAQADQRLNTPNSAVAASLVGQTVFDYAHRRFYIANATDKFDWQEILQPARGNSNPTNGNFQFGQIARLYDFGALTAGSSMGLVATDTGTMGTLVGITGTINNGSTSLTVNSTTGLSVGCYITIAGVSGRKQVRAIVGTTVTIDSAADASVVGAAVAYYNAAFAEFGTVKAQGSDSWTPGTINNGASASKTVSVGTAALGDLAIGSFSLDLSGCSISAYVSSAGTVTVVISNNTGGSVTLGAGTARARVFKQ